MFVIVSVFIAFNIYGGTFIGLVTALIGVVIVYIMAGRVKPTKASTALTYGLIWVICGVLLDAIVTMRFNPDIFRSWTLWLSYGLGLFTPLLQVKKSSMGNETV